MKKLKAWIPEEAMRILRHLTGYGGCFRGEFASWAEAAARCEGYSAEGILQRVLDATIAVRDGKAAFERDGVLFDEADDRYPLLAALMYAAAQSGGHLKLLDFGGALGSCYFQCRKWLAHLPSVTWCVVEQPHFVEAGNAQLADGKLIFAPSIEAARQHTAFDVVLFSGVLQYLEAPEAILAAALAAKPRLLVIDRTPVIRGDQDVIRVQQQSAVAGLVASSYPIRLFAQASILKVAAQGYRLLSGFDAVDAPMGGIGSRVDFKGFIFEREA